jgi:hypothetical protein
VVTSAQFPAGLGPLGIARTSSTPHTDEVSSCSQYCAQLH